MWNKKIRLVLQTFAVIVLISLLVNFTFMSELETDSGKTYAIQTAGCTIPETNTNPVNRTGLKIPDCSYEETLSTLNDENQMLQLTSQYTYSNCCLQTIQRIVDLKYKLSDCKQIHGDGYTDVSDKEMFITRCGDHLNFEANFKLTPSVSAKINKWKSTPEDKVPISVLFVGIDSISRSMLHRCVPNTVDYIKRMGFVDFKGYHSAGPATVWNVYQFLMGLTKDEVSKGCHPNWTSPFDPCPFIWKNYSENGYITMFNEDGHQTFNFGVQSGFNDQPTDYYTHSLFSAVEDMRLNVTYKMLKLTETNENLETYAYCTSRESVPKFVKRYTQRFLMKFANVPTFSYTWFENPFHDFTGQVLSNYDDHFLDFFQFLNSTPQILDDTFIVFGSDHGAIFHYPEGSESDRFLEQNAPFLFIRIPKKLQRDYPEEDIRESLKLNAERLTTPLDLHKTFLHVLHLSKRNNFRTSEFQPNLLSTSSLLLPVNPNRTCDNIKVVNCVCEVPKNNDPVTEGLLLEKMNIFSVEQLNRFVKDSNYSKLCRKWQHTNQYSATYVRKTKEYQDALFNFEASPRSAKFQVKIRISESKELERIGEFLRTSEYGNQSWCVAFNTDLDKQIKGACVCN